VVLCTATINRVMIVELALLALIPAMLVGIYQGIQLLRPAWGHGADQGAMRTPWVIGGMLILALGTVGAAVATAWMETVFWPALALAVVAFTMVGLGLGASATNLLAILAAHVAPGRKAAAGSLVWILMIAGLAASGITIGQVLDPYSGLRLVYVSLGIAAIAITVTLLSLWGLERRAVAAQLDAAIFGDGGEKPRTRFLTALAEIWSDRQARLFAIFVFVSMLAYNTQDLILEPYGGHVFGMTPGQSTALGGSLHAGALLGMVLVFITGLIVRSAAPIRIFMIGGCIASGIALIALALGGQTGADWPITANVIVLGFCNGVFAVAAIGAMMRLASEGKTRREGTRMGVFGAAQAIGFAIGAATGAAALDALRTIFVEVKDAYGTVFAIEGTLFLISAILAWRAMASIHQTDGATGRAPAAPAVQFAGE